MTTWSVVLVQTFVGFLESMATDSVSIKMATASVAMIEGSVRTIETAAGSMVFHIKNFGVASPRSSV